jgi:hypothetical protein
MPVTQEAEIERIRFKASPGKQLVRPYLNKQAGHGGASNPISMRGKDRRIIV